MSILSRTSLDVDIWDEELDSFVPPRIFDAHTHLWSTSAAGAEGLAENGWGCQQTDLPALRGIFRTLYPGREVHCLTFGLPVAGTNQVALNQWVADQAGRDSRTSAAMLIGPRMSAQSVAEAIERKGFAALKPYYHLGPASSSGIAAYFPEQLMGVAHALKLPVVLHCRHGVAGDLDELVGCCRRFPGIRWILAHCGAMFNPRGLKRCVQRLRAFPNVWYDTALICEVDTLAIVLRHADRTRVLFGTDSAMGIGGCRRGRVLSYAHSVLWLKQTASATFWAYEQLRALARCCDLLDLCQREIDGLFYSNAVRLFGSSISPGPA
jgi:glutamate-1-semialdehyde 2,1-aminomutase